MLFYLFIYYLFLLLFTFSPQKYFYKKNAEATPSQRDLGSIREKIHIQNLKM
jgi:hypothetical protein